MEDLILENEGLIYKCASYFRPYDIEDLYQAGCLGIMYAFDNYDASFETKFSTYAYPYIMGQMKKLISDDKPLKLNRDMIRLKNKINEARDRLSQILMYEPTDKQLSEYLNIPEYLIETSNIVIGSLDSTVADNLSLHEIISDKVNDIDSLIYLKNELENLEEPERSIMIGRYYEDMTQSEIADFLGLTQVNVSRREGKVLTKLRNAC